MAEDLSKVIINNLFSIIYLFIFVKFAISFTILK